MATVATILVDMTNTEPSPLAINTRVKIEKGCKARGIDKGCTAQVRAIEPMGAEHTHCVRVTLLMLNGFKSGKSFSFYARHINRLSDVFVRMNDGNPSHTIEIKRAS